MSHFFTSELLGTVHDVLFIFFRGHSIHAYSAIEWQRLPRKVFRRSTAWLSDSLSTLRGAGYPNATQDSLPVALQTLLDGLSTRKLPMNGFKFAICLSFPLSSLLGAIDATARMKNSRRVSC